MKNRTSSGGGLNPPREKPAGGWLRRLAAFLKDAEPEPHVHRWFPTVDGIGYADASEIHCGGCGSFMHLRGGKYVDGRNPNRHKCVHPQWEIFPNAVGSSKLRQEGGPHGR